MARAAAYRGARAVKVATPARVATASNRVSLSISLGAIDRLDTRPALQYVIAGAGSVAAGLSAYVKSRRRLKFRQRLCF
jgi:hypothetical protein